MFLNFIKDISFYKDKNLLTPIKPTIMKNLFYIVVCASLIFTSCEKESVDVLPVEVESNSTELTIGAKGAWKQILWEPFNAGSSITSNWTKTNGRKDYNSRLCNYVSWSPRLEKLDGKDCLRLTAWKHGSEYRSGHVKSKKTFKPNYNEEVYVTAMIKLIARDGNSYKGFNQTYGVWPAFWTVQENQWPTKGEIDIMEGYSYGGYSNFASNLFYGSRVDNNQLSNTARYYDISEGWHKYQMRWVNNKGAVSVYIYIDDKYHTKYTNNASNNLKLENFGSHNVILNLNVGSNDGIFNNSNIDIFSTTSMYVDWVSVKRRTL